MFKLKFLPFNKYDNSKKLFDGTEMEIICFVFQLIIIISRLLNKTSEWRAVELTVTKFCQQVSYSLTTFCNMKHFHDSRFQFSCVVITLSCNYMKYKFQDMETNIKFLKCTKSWIMSWIKAVEWKPKYNKRRQTLDKKRFGEQNSG